jgi:5-hydroxyisourate hydrolase
MGRLTTHVLDTARGVPAAGVDVDLHIVTGDSRTRIATVTTNNAGRTDAPLAEGAALAAGVYELTFRVANYLRGTGVTLSDPPFLGDVVIRVGIADASAHYHIPLLLSPYGYSTYRGS